MSLVLSTLLLLPTIVPIEPGASPCTNEVADLVQVLGPRSAETDVPLNTSLWISVTGDPAQLTLALHDDAQVAVPLQVEVLYTRGGAAAVRARPEADLRPLARYSVEWRLGELSGGYLFDTGSTRDTAPPPAPRILAVTGYDARRCDAGVELGVRIDSPDPRLLYEGSANGAVVGLSRELALVLHVVEPQLDVVGAVVAVDLAGNRSNSVGYQTTTPSRSDAAGCSTTGGGDTALLLVCLAVALALPTRPRTARATRARTATPVQ